MCNYRIATTEVGLERGWFRYLKIPPPTTVDYKAFSEKKARTTGGQVLHGYKNLTILWTNIGVAAARRITRYVDYALSTSGTGLLYVTFDMFPNRDWVDVSGIPHPMDPQVLQGPFQIYGNAGLGGYSNLTLYLNNITIINDPSSAV